MQAKAGPLKIESHRVMAAAVISKCFNGGMTTAHPPSEIPARISNLSVNIHRQQAMRIADLSNPPSRECVHSGMGNAVRLLDLHSEALLLILEVVGRSGKDQR